MFINEQIDTYGNFKSKRNERPSSMDFFAPSKNLQIPLSLWQERNDSLGKKYNFKNGITDKAIEPNNISLKMKK